MNNNNKMGRLGFLLVVAILLASLLQIRALGVQH